MNLFYKIAVISCLVLAGQANAVVVESFDSGNWGAGWSSSSAGVVNAGAAHDGAFGVTLGNTSWTYNTSLAVGEGDTISAWIRPASGSDGRVYLGFGADATGTQSLVGATNTGDVIFQDNAGYNFTDLQSVGAAWNPNQWYLLEIDWTGGGNAIGNLYGSDGTTLLNSLSVSGLSRSAGGIALRGFGGWDLDTVSVNARNAVPEPGTLALFGLSLAALVASRRRKVA